MCRFAEVRRPDRCQREGGGSPGREFHAHAHHREHADARGTYLRQPEEGHRQHRQREDQDVVTHRMVAAVFSLVGFLLSLYLWLWKIGVMGPIACGSGSCEYVQTSSYAYVLGVPVAAV